MFKTWLAWHREIHLGTATAVRRMREREERQRRMAPDCAAAGGANPHDTLQSPAVAAPSDWGPYDTNPDDEEGDITDLANEDESFVYGEDDAGVLYKDPRK